jgi:hypothetical protein
VGFLAEFFSQLASLLLRLPQVVKPVRVVVRVLQKSPSLWRKVMRSDMIVLGLPSSAGGT